MSDRLTTAKGAALRRTLPPEVFLLIMKAVLDEAESSTASQSWMIDLAGDWLGHGPEFFIIEDEPVQDNFNKLQQSRFLKVRSVSQVNRMTQTMVHNRFSPLRCYSPWKTIARVLVFPKIDSFAPSCTLSLESIKSALANQSHHVSRCLQSIESTTLMGGLYSLSEKPEAETEAEIKRFISTFPNMKVTLLPTYWGSSFPLATHDTGHDHDELLLLSSEVLLCPMALQKFEFGPVAPVLKPLWEKKVRLLGTADVGDFKEGISRQQPIVELVQTSQGLRMRIFDPQCPLCKV